MTKKGKHNKSKKQRKEICAYGNVMVHRCPRRSHMETGRGHGEKGEAGEKEGKRGREIEK